jgi:hypothetical protein
MKRTTPSQAVTYFEIGWLAGIIDGEGSIAHYYCVRKNRPDLKKSPIYGVYIINSDLGILEKVKSIYNRLGLFANINIKSSSRKNREESFHQTKTCYELVVRRRNDVELLLKTVTPHLVGYKKDKALKLLSFFLQNPFNNKSQLRV